MMYRNCQFGVIEIKRHIRTKSLKNNDQMDSKKCDLKQRMSNYGIGLMIGEWKKMTVS